MKSHKKNSIASANFVYLFLAAIAQTKTKSKRAKSPTLCLVLGFVNMTIIIKQFDEYQFAKQYLL